MKRTTRVFITILIAVAIGLIYELVSFYIAFSKTTWGGWTPPSTALELTPNELLWKKNIESHYQCRIRFIGLEPSFTEDSILYIDIDYNDKSILRKKLNSEIESITGFISSLFVSASGSKRTQSHILINYTRHKSTNVNLLESNIPDNRYCMYHIKTSTVLPTVQKLVIPRLMYYDFCNNDLFEYKIGKSIRNTFCGSAHMDSLSKYFYIRKTQVFKSLDSCHTFTSKSPYRIKMTNGFLESTHTYTFFDNECISVVINYKCFPENAQFHPADFIKKVTEIDPKRLAHSKKENPDRIGLLKTNHYSLSQKMWGVHVKFSVDTLKKPWSITYETSLDEFNYYRTL